MNPLEPRFVTNQGEVAAEVLDGEAVLINLSTGIYYSLVGAGSLIWSALECGLGEARIVELVCATYQVEISTAQTDTRALIESLKSENLIVLADSTVASVEAPLEAFETLVERLPYQAPHLNVYNDMQQLLALDPPMPDLTDAPHKPGAATP